MSDENPAAEEERAPDPLEAWAGELIERRVRDFEVKRAAVLERAEDAEALHDVRTRARRLRAALEDLRELVPEAEEMLGALKRFSRRTGEARDNDVLLARVEWYAEHAFGRARAQFERLAGRLRKRRGHSRTRAMDGVRECRLRGSAEGESP